MIIINQHISLKGNWSLRGKCWWFSGEAVEQWRRWPLDLSACCLLLDMKAERVDSGRAVETLRCKKQNKTKSPAVGGCKTKAKQQFRGPSNPKMSSGKMILALFPSDYQVRKKILLGQKNKNNIQSSLSNIYIYPGNTCACSFRALCSASRLLGRLVFPVFHASSHLFMVRKHINQLQ